MPATSSTTLNEIENQIDDDDEPDDEKQPDVPNDREMPEPEQ